MDPQQLTALIEARRDTFFYTRVIPEYKGFWMSLQKVASITTAIALAKLEGLEKNQWGDEGISELQHYTTPEIVEILTSPDWFRFCFVRNPYDRVFSAYKSKIGRVESESYYQSVQQKIRERYDYPDHDGQRPRVAFRDFIRFIRDSGDRDPHWNVQTERLLLDMIPYDLIGRYENFREDFEKAMVRLGAPDAIRALGDDQHGKSYKVPLAVAYDAELAAEVHAIYQQDFETFDYDKDSWMFI